MKRRVFVLLKKKTVCVVLALILLLGCFSVAASADTCPVYGKTYLIQTPTSGKYVSNNGAKEASSDVIGIPYAGSYSTGYRASEL